MCPTNYIATLFAAIPASAHNNSVQISMRRSDGELFTMQLNMLTNAEANKIKELFNYMEELRTCFCTGFAVCNKHSSIRAKEKID